MKKIFLLFFVAVLIMSFFVLKDILFPNGKIYYKTTHYNITNEKGNQLKCQIFEKENGMLIILFENKKRLYINFKEKLIGLPENGYGNYILKKNKLILYKENIFHKNGYLYKPLLKGIDDVDFEFTDDVMKLSCFSFLCNYGKVITVKKIK
ncbi:hypothetical protein [Chryseobacterium gossypii]|uniref:hypothetical protein n=1 Tax=Chryseobacterium gossypii TaxID=3231602 RepID=UPI0035236438